MTRKTTATALLSAASALAVMASAACADDAQDLGVPELDAIALHREQAATDPGGGGTTPPPSGPPAYCAYIPADANFPRISDGFSMYAGAVSEPEKSSSSWNLPSTPTGQGFVWVKWTLPYPACPPVVSEANIAAYGKVTVDGSTAGVEYFHIYPSGVPNEFSATVDMPTTNIFGGHSIKLSYLNPRAGRYGTPITSTRIITFTQTNPFFYLQRSYADSRCQVCHAFGAGSLAYNDPKVGHSFPINPDTGVGCQGCHAPFYDQYHPTETRHQWMVPGPQKGIDWSQMSPFGQCLVTVAHLPSAAALHDHFDNDPRLKWAVESGLTHYGMPARPTAFPHNVASFTEMADAWIDQGFSCAGIDPPTRWNTHDAYAQE